MGATTLEKITRVLLSEYYNVLGAHAPSTFSPEAILHGITNYYQRIINSMPCNVYWIDKNCTMVGCNQNVLNMLKLNSIDNFKKLTFEDLGRIGEWTEHATHSFKQDTLEVIRTKQAKLNIEEPPIPNQHGKLIYFLSSRVPLLDDHNEILGIVGISVDITQRREAEIQLKLAKEKEELANRAKDEFIANMSHDVKAPIAGIVGIAELLITEDQLQQRERDFVQTILTSSRQVLNFFDDCVTLAKLSSGGLTFVYETFKLADLVKEITQLFQPMLYTKKLNFHVHYHENIYDFFYGARSGLYRILLNLIGNAIKFTNSGSISLYIQPSYYSTLTQPTLEFVVADTGIGIPKEKLATIFDRYSRVNSPAASRYEGHGIGLHLVQEFVKTLNGSIHVVSEINKGSKFIVTLPFQPVSNQISLESMQTPNKQQLEAVEKIAPFARPVKILLIEDNAIAQQVTQLLLSSLGCTVDIAESGQEAFELFSPGKYDLIFTDIQLPDIEGSQIAKSLRDIETDSSTYHCPIIALTTHITEAIRINCANSGVNEVLSKPLSYKQLHQLVNDYVIKPKTSS